MNEELRQKLKEEARKERLEELAGSLTAIGGTVAFVIGVGYLAHRAEMRKTPDLAPPSKIIKEVVPDRHPCPVPCSVPSGLNFTPVP